MAKIGPENKKLQGLYIVPTPIGNLRDITARALDTLSAVDLIACEDTRVTGKLLHHFGIETRMLSYHEHNSDMQLPKILDHLKEGSTVALVSDAGTPLVSDPGYRLVVAVREEGIPVIPLPGPVAAITALSAAGLPCDQFGFFGFLPNKQKARQQVLSALQDFEGTAIFYETAPRILATLEDALNILGDRRAAIGRELTKLHEEVVQNNISGLLDFYSKNPPKGEIVLMIAPAVKEANRPVGKTDALLMTALTELSVKSAAALVAELTGESRKPLYQRALALKSENRHEPTKP